jgi:hypothetical protein
MQDDTWIRADKDFFSPKIIRTDGNLQVGPNGDVFLVNSTTRNVGIGTYDPKTKLDVNGKVQFSINNSGGFSFDPNDGGMEIASFNDGVSYIDFKGKNYLNQDFVGRLFYEDGKGFEFLHYTPTGSVKSLLKLVESGNVGIGTTPDEKLTVDGTVHAKEVRIDLHIPADYVFQKYYTGNSSLNPEYKLPSLEEVELFTQTHHHLPGIPSSQEIQQNGLKIGEMSNLLLQKIEELILYSIEQDKLIKGQQNELNTLKKQLSEIQHLNK